MTIFENDVKLLESERLSDEPDGGGRLTGTEVEDNEANNLFPDISDLDRTTGRVQLRKAFLAVLSPNTDTYHGAHVIIDEPPKDPNVHATLFNTESWTDEREEARDRLESWVIPSVEAPMYLFGNHPEGVKSIRALQRLSAPAPEAGDIFQLSIESGENDGQNQYVRVQKVETREREFEDGSGVFTRRELTMEITEALRDDYGGDSAKRKTNDINPETLIRETQVADAASYYSIHAVEEAPKVDDTEVKIPDLFTNIVPAAESEEAVTDESATTTVSIEVESGGETLEVQDNSTTDRIHIELANRQSTYVQELIPKPAPGTIRVEYRSQGRWQRLEDDGEGQLEGSGGGTVDYDTGTVSVTVAELPDVPSAMVFTWGDTEADFVDGAGEDWATIDDPEFSIDLDEEIEPDSLTIEWTNDGTTYSLTDDGEGTLTGDGDGRVTYTRQDFSEVVIPPKVRLRPDPIPDPGSTIQITADKREFKEETFDVSPDEDGEVSFQISEEVDDKGLTIVWLVERSVEWEKTRRSGTEADEFSNERTFERVAYGRTNGEIRRESDDEVIGSIDYSTGDVSLEVVEPYDFEYREKDKQWEGVKTTERTETETLKGRVRARFRDPDQLPDEQLDQQYEVDDGGVEANLLGLNTNLSIVPGTVRFEWDGVTYGDNDGELRRDPSGDNTAAGTINYGSGDIRITDLPSDTSGSIEIKRLIASSSVLATQVAAFRTPGPQRDGSLIVQATSVTGTLKSATANIGGELDEDGITGEVDSQTGFVEVEFDEPVVPSTIRYSTVAVSFIPVDADIIGLDPVRLPRDGRVPMARVGDVCVIHHTDTTDLGDGDSETDLGFTRLSYVHVFDGDGERVSDDDVIADLDAGTVEVDQSTESPAPFSAEYRIEDMRLIADVQITGVISLASKITHDYPEENTYLSTAVLYGDLQADWTNMFDQETWDGEWSDDRQGDRADASYNSVDYPPEVTNEGAIQERWVLEFDSTTTVNVIGEVVGQVLTGASIDEDIAPTNPNTDVPYFTLPADGWGGGWATGNALRFNTRAANRPLWIARTITTGDEEEDSDSFRLQLRGDAN